MHKINPGDHAVQFINNLMLSDDYMGQQYNLRPWQADPIRKLFGTRRPDGTRRYKTFLYGLPRGSGKTALAAAIALYLLLGEGKRGQIINSCSGDREQASLIFKAAASSVTQDEYLSSRVIVYHSTKKLVDTETGNTYQALSNDYQGRLKFGKNPSACIFDECAFWNNEGLYTAIESGMLKRTDPLSIHISTAGFDINNWFYKNIWRYGEQVLNGSIKDESFLPVIYAAKPEDDPLDPQVWKRVMPALGDFASLEFVERKAELARQLPSNLEQFKTLYLNLWGNSCTRWIPIDRWDACQSTEVPEPGTPAYYGLDLASVHDLAALVLVFPVDGGYIVKPYGWVPSDNASIRQQIDNVPYKYWIDQGFLEGTPGESINYDYIKEKILELNEVYPCMLCGIDPWNGTHLGTQLEKEGIHVELYRQGFASLNYPSKVLERCILEKQIHHDGNPVLKWCIGNCVVQTDEAGNIKPSKKHSEEKIDMAVALVMALGVYLGGGKEPFEPQIISL